MARQKSPRVDPFPGVSRDQDRRRRRDYLKRRYRFWLSRTIDGTIKAGCFAQDARGRWHLCLQVEVADNQVCGSGKIGIHLGLETLATLSTGEKIPNPRHFHRYEAALADLVKAKLRGQKIATRKEPRRAKAIDLLAALRESAGMARRKASARSGRKPRRATKVKAAAPRRKAS